VPPNLKAARKGEIGINFISSYAGKEKKGITGKQMKNRKECGRLPKGRFSVCGDAEMA